MLAYWLVRLLLALNPPPSVYAFLLRTAVPRLKRVALENLAHAGYDNGEPIANGVFLSLGRLMHTFAQFPRMTRENIGQWIRYEGLDNFIQARARGRGVLVATAHFGNWELSAFSHALMTGPMHVVVRTLDNPRLDRLVEERRALSGNTIIRKQDAAREIITALRKGEAVGILIDQNVVPAEGVFIDFFGRKASAGTAFAKLANHTGAAVVPGFAVWSEAERKYVLHFLPEVPMTGDVAGDTQKIHGVLEWAIRRHPDQWLWIHRRWKTQPTE